MMSSRTRPTLISRVWATGRDPFGFNPVTAAIPATTTARPIQTSQFIQPSSTKVRPLTGSQRAPGGQK